MTRIHSQQHSRARLSSRASETRGRRPIAIMLAAALLYLPLSHSLKVEASGMKPYGQITTRGLSKVDGVSAISGETIFSGSSITTEQEASATVNLGRLGRVELLPDSGVQLNFNETSITGSLVSGGVGVSLPEGIPGAVTTNEASVIASGQEPALFFVTIKDGATIVTAETGGVQLQAFGKTLQVAAGESASASHGNLSLTTGQPQIGSQQNNLSGGKKAGLFLALGGAVAIILILLLRRDDNCTQTTVSGITSQHCT